MRYLASLRPRLRSWRTLESLNDSDLSEMLQVLTKEDPYGDGEEDTDDTIISEIEDSVSSSYIDDSDCRTRRMPVESKVRLRV